MFFKKRPIDLYLKLVQKRLKILENQGFKVKKPIPYIAEKINLHPSTVSNWTYKKDKNRTASLGGKIPHKHIPKLIKLARELGIKNLKAKDLL